MADAKRDNNQVTTLLAVSSVDGVTPVVLYADPTTHRLLVSSASGSLATLSDVTLTSVAQGDILYYNGTAWVNLAHGTSGQFLKTQGASANPIWATVTASAAGSTTQVQYNSAGSLAGAAGFTFDGTSVVTLGVAGTSVGAVAFKNATSGTITLQPVTGALGTVTLSLPAATDTLMGKATTDTMTNKTLDTAGTGNVLKINGTTVSAVTGTGSVVLGTSPTIATPVLNGTPTGTGVATAATASTLALRDANANLTVNQIIDGYTTTATAGGTTTLTVGSTQKQFFTGSSTQTVVLPDVTTLVLGQDFLVDNNSSGNVTVQSSGLNNVVILAPNTRAVLTCILTTGTTAASWDAHYYAVAPVSGKKISLSDSITFNTNSITFAGGEVLTLTATNALTLTTTGSTSVTLPTSGTLYGTASGSITSAQLATSLTDETGSGVVVFGTSPTITTPTIQQINSTANNPVKINAGSYTPTQTYTPSAAGTATLDLSLGNVHFITMPAGNITIALSNATVGQVFMIRILQDATGSRTVTWFTTIKWAGGSAPTLTTTASKADTMGFICTGSGTYDGFVIGQNI